MTNDERVTALERELTEVIDRSKSLIGLSERDWCEVIASACEVIKVGKEMRLEELSDEDE